MTTTIVNDFKTYRDLMKKLNMLYSQYQRLLNSLIMRRAEERVLNETISDEEKEEIEQDILDLENSIEGTIKDISRLLRYLNANLEKEYAALTEKEVYEANEYHINVMNEYFNCDDRLETLKKWYPNYDFSKIDFFSALEAKRTRLDIAIKRYNNFNLRLMEYKLLTGREAQAVAWSDKTELVNRQKRKFFPNKEQ